MPSPLNLAWVRTEHPAFGRLGLSICVRNCEFIGNFDHEAGALAGYAHAGSSLNKWCIPFSLGGAGRDTASRNRAVVPLAILHWPDFLDWSAGRIAAARPKAIGATLKKLLLARRVVF